jgi:hypothetical protein
MNIPLKTICMSGLLASSTAMAQIPSATPTAEDDRQLTIMFGQVDADRNERVTKTELSSFGATHGLGTIVLRQGWNDMDRDRDGKLTRQEFVNGMVAARAAKAARLAK